VDDVHPPSPADEEYTPTGVRFHRRPAAEVLADQLDEADAMAAQGNRIAARQSVGDPSATLGIEASTRPRHRGLAGELQALLRWKAAVTPIVPLQSNWSIVPANDNAPPLAENSSAERGGMLVDRLTETRPRVKETLRQMGDAADFRTFRHARFGGDGEWDIAPTAPDTRDNEGQVVRIGRLRFSDGTAEEPCMRWSGGKLVFSCARVPAGGLTHYSDRWRVSDEFSEQRGNGRHDEAQAWASVRKSVSTGSVAHPNNFAEAQLDALARAGMSDTDVKVLDKAISADNFADVGAVLGLSGKRAEREGQIALRRAVKNFSASIQNLAA
jgi:hypothetical protein